MEPWGIPVFNGQEKIRSLSKTLVRERKERISKEVKKRISERTRLRDPVD